MFSTGKATPVKKAQAFGLDDLFVNSLNLARDFCDKGDSYDVENYHNIALRAKLERHDTG